MTDPYRDFPWFPYGYIPEPHEVFDAWAVQWLRRKVEEGTMMARLERQAGVGHRHMRNLIARRSYKWVPEAPIPQ